VSFLASAALVAAAAAAAFQCLRLSALVRAALEASAHFCSLAILGEYCLYSVHSDGQTFYLSASVASDANLCSSVQAFNLSRLGFPEATDLASYF
jgi:hypothetical protein